MTKRDALQRLIEEFDKGNNCGIQRRKWHLDNELGAREVRLQTTGGGMYLALDKPLWFKRRPEDHGWEYKPTLEDELVADWNLIWH